MSDSENKMKRMRQELAASKNADDEPFIVYGCGAHALNLLMGDLCYQIKKIIKQY